MKQTVSNDLFWPNTPERAMAKKKSVTIPSRRWEFHCLPPNAPGTFQLISTCCSLHPSGSWRAQAPQDVQESHIHAQKSVPGNCFSPWMGSHSQQRPKGMGCTQGTPASGGFPAGANLAELAPDHGRGYSPC